MLNLIGKEPAHERRIEPEEDSMGRRVQPKVCEVFIQTIPRKWRENPKGNKEIWESSVRLGHKTLISDYDCEFKGLGMRC